ncbi:Uma2 family endonuclease [Leptolyngbya sp. DQ-M1]|uniref:Uma2 family endonuclease n=1 Tax=Leptolyngbya sp. DQ-M1 TaxID=2933920 RepID=UPI003297C119
MATTQDAYELAKLLAEIEYPDSDGKPMAETDFQREYLIYSVSVLDLYFQNQPDVYVSGNILIYYEEGNSKACLSPDVFVVKNQEKRKRRSYKVWEEGEKYPNFVLEITSKSTVNEDQGSKKGLYAFWGVEEYFQYDPTADYLKPQLKGFRLIEGNYFPIPQVPLDQPNDFSLRSEVLGIDLCLKNQDLKFFEAGSGIQLLGLEETESARRAAELRAEQEAQRADRLAAKLRELGTDPEQL